VPYNRRFVKIYKSCRLCVVMKLDYASYVLVIVVGFVMLLAVVSKLVFGFDIDSDWFWFLAGFGLALEAVISFKRQKRFDAKYKVVKRV